MACCWLFGLRGSSSRFAYVLWNFTGARGWLVFIFPTWWYKPQRYRLRSAETELLRTGHPARGLGGQWQLHWDRLQCTPTCQTGNLFNICERIHTSVHACVMFSSQQATLIRKHCGQACHPLLQMTTRSIELGNGRARTQALLVTTGYIAVGIWLSFMELNDATSFHFLNGPMRWILWFSILQMRKQGTKR